MDIRLEDWKPPKGRVEKGKSKYPFHVLELGDSFSFKPDKRLIRIIHALVTTQGKVNSKKFTSKMDDDGRYRVFRME